MGFGLVFVFIFVGKFHLSCGAALYFLPVINKAEHRRNAVFRFYLKAGYHAGKTHTAFSLTLSLNLRGLARME